MSGDLRLVLDLGSMTALPSDRPGPGTDASAGSPNETASMVKGQQMVSVEGATALKTEGLRAPVAFSISGHSSGGAMASAHFFAFSDRVIGMGQLESCAAFGTLADAQAAAGSGGIAALANVKRAKVYAMQGGDVTCPAGQACHCTTQGDTCDTCGCCCAAVAGEFYRTLGADVEFKLVPHAHHGFVTDRGPAELAGCDATVCVPCGDRNRTGGDGMVQECGCDSSGLYPIVALQYSSTTLSHITYHIQSLFF